MCSAVTSPGSRGPTDALRPETGDPARFFSLLCGLWLLPAASPVALTNAYASPAFLFLRMTSCGGHLSSRRGGSGLPVHDGHMAGPIISLLGAPAGRGLPLNMMPLTSTHW